jgi:hypothetical protein
MAHLSFAHLHKFRSNVVDLVLTLRSGNDEVGEDENGECLL